MSYINQLNVLPEHEPKLLSIAKILNTFPEFRGADSSQVAKLLLTYDVDGLLGYNYEYDSITKYRFVLDWIKPDKIAKFIQDNYIQSLHLSKVFKNKRHSGCYAPYMTLNFAQNGSVGVCCYTSRNEFALSKGGYLGKYPDSTIKELWTGKNMQKIRNSLDAYQFNVSEACSFCIKRVKNGDAANSLITKFDSKLFGNYEEYKKKFKPVDFLREGYAANIKEYYSNLSYPLLLEFELSNICNYECIMCGGDYSSLVRRNVEKRPALESPYDSKFVDQLQEFLPHAVEFDFLGGEPFLIPIYYEIWDKIKILNRDAKINITTNGSILNDKVKNIIEGFPNLSITVSLDSVNPDTYALIRKHGNLDKVLNNLEYFISKARKVGISVCPMIQNIYEMHDIVQFCIDKKVGIYFNSVTGSLKAPFKNSDFNLPEVALSTVSADEKEKIIKYLCSKTYVNKSTRHHMALNGLIENIINS